MANNTAELMGDYPPDVDPHFMTTPLSRLSHLDSIYSLYTAGCNETKCSEYNEKEVKYAVSQADVTFLCLGTGA